MLFNRATSKYNVLKSEGKDEYACNLPYAPTGEVVEGTLGIYSHTQVEDIRYSHADYIMLTKDEVTDDMILERDGSKYKVEFVNPYGRLKQVYLSEWH